MAKDNDVTSIRIPRSVKAELQDLALEKEPMHLTIQRLIKENDAMKKRISGLESEKQSFMDTVNVLTAIVNKQDEVLKETGDNGAGTNVVDLH